MRPQRTRVEPEIFLVLARQFPEFCVAGNVVEVPAGVTPEALNSKLARYGLEAWSRFPGLSIRFRRLEARDRGAELAERWKANKAQMSAETKVFPYTDELWITRLESLFQIRMEKAGPGYRLPEGDQVGPYLTHKRGFFHHRMTIPVAIMSAEASSRLAEAMAGFIRDRLRRPSPLGYLVEDLSPIRR